jgi:cytochrome d ubiquinol oxidase subunit II
MSIEIIMLTILGAALVLYAVFGGADFGAGVWEFNTALRASERERNLLYHAIGPVWETNHVWLIFVLVLLFGAFPPAFASIHQALFVPMLLGLVGIVFRGAAYAFRSQLKSDPRRQRMWLAIFALASVMAPFFLGAAVGALASGQLEFDPSGHFTGDHVFGWINLLSIFSGFFAVGMCVYLAATFMIRESLIADMQDLEMVWRRRALITGLVMGVFALTGLGIITSQYPDLTTGLVQRGWPAVVVSMASGLLSLWAIWSRRLALSTIAVALATAAVVIGWQLAQYPTLVPGVWTINNAAAHPNVLRLMLLVTVVGSSLLIPSIALLLFIFKSNERA